MAIRIWLIAVVGQVLLSGCSKKHDPSLLPTVTTIGVTGITAQSAISGGNIVSDGGSAILGRGVCWATDSLPTIANHVTTDSTGSGTFVSTLTGLAPSTLYYARAYATNSVGTVYGNQVMFETESILNQQVDFLTSAAWSASAVTHDGDDQFASYLDLKLTVTGHHGVDTLTFTATGRPSIGVWPTHGTLVLAAAAPDQMLYRNDGPLEITYQASASTLVMSFTYNGGGFPGRASDVVTGNWVFQFQH